MTDRGDWNLRDHQHRSPLSSRTVRRRPCGAATRLHSATVIPGRIRAYRSRAVPAAQARRSVRRAAAGVYRTVAVLDPLRVASCSLIWERARGRHGHAACARRRDAILVVDARRRCGAVGRPMNGDVGCVRARNGSRCCRRSLRGDFSTIQDARPAGESVGRPMLVVVP